MKKRFLLIGVALLLAVSIIPAAAFTQIQQPMGIQIDVEPLGSASPTLNIIDNTGTTDAAEIGFIGTSGPDIDKYFIDFSQVPLAIAQKQVMQIGGPVSGYDASEQDNYDCERPGRNGPYAGITVDYTTVDYIFEMQNNHPDQNFKVWIIMGGIYGSPMDDLPPPGMTIELWCVRESQGSSATCYREFLIDSNGVTAGLDEYGDKLCTLCSETEDIDDDSGDGGHIKLSHRTSKKYWMVVKTDGTCEIDDYNAKWRLIANTLD